MLPRSGQTGHRANAGAVLNAGYLPRAAGGALLWVLALGLVLGLGGCATQQATVGPGEAGLPDLVLKTPVGLPGKLAARLVTQLQEQLSQRRISLAKQSDGLARYNLQGFCSVVPSKTEVGLACVWDVVDPSGARAHRIVSEQSIPGAPPADPWSVVSTTILDNAAKTTANKVANWLQSAPREYSFLSPSSSFFRGRTRIALTGVTGAPGDGNKSLAAAFNAALKARGLQVATRAGAAYLVAGKVKISNDGLDRQNVVIDWTVRDRAGVALGSVNQRNKVSQGALDGKWGDVAKGAASAAVAGVIRLLPGR
ncbi:MAG: hypothetical protein ACTSY1_02115 [Alphaproteobacteria bacterium]